MSLKAAVLTFVLFLCYPHGIVGWECKQTEEGASSENITIEGTQHKFPVGHEIEVKCETNTNFTLQWTTSDGDIIVNSTDGRITVVDGVFTIRDSIVNDTDTYYCTAGSYAESYFICVYVMPTYMREGIIILSVLGVLMVIFCACLIRTETQQKKENKCQYKDVPNRQDQYLEDVVVPS